MQVNGMGEIRFTDLFNTDTLKMKATAAAQEKIGKFLEMKRLIVDAMGSSNTETAYSAGVLYQNQEALEKELAALLPSLQSGALDVTTMGEAASFLVRIDNHIAEVQKLTGQTVSSPNLFGGDWLPWTLAIGAGLYILVKAKR